MDDKITFHMMGKKNFAVDGHCFLNSVVVARQGPVIAAIAFTPVGSWLGHGVADRAEHARSLPWYTVPQAFKLRDAITLAGRDKVDHINT